jgi:hypothetical protein
LEGKIARVDALTGQEISVFTDSVGKWVNIA